MNVYDFDGTIYDGDSTVDFFLYALKKKLSIVRCFPKQVKGFLLYALGEIGKTELKECFFSFLPALNGKEILTDFWCENDKKIMDWYLKQKKPDDLVISASPEFLLRPVCEKLGINNLIASQMDMDTGKYKGKNCRGEEKVCRYHEIFGQTPIENFYSDSQSDLPMARLADRAYLLHKGTVTEWKHRSP